MSTPEITVAAVTERAGRFLLVEERIEGRLVLNQPAGHLEHGETLVEAVVREVREETAWRFSVSALVGVYLWRQPRTGRLFKRFTFAGSVSDHRAGQPLDAGIVATRWLTPEQIRASGARLRSPLVLRSLEDFLRGTRSALADVAQLDLDSAGAVAAAEV